MERRPTVFARFPGFLCIEEVPGVRHTVAALLLFSFVENARSPSGRI